MVHQRLGRLTLSSIVVRLLDDFLFKLLLAIDAREAIAVDFWKLQDFIGVTLKELLLVPSPTHTSTIHNGTIPICLISLDSDFIVRGDDSSALRVESAAHALFVVALGRHGC